jgi:hypothetical protein
MEGHREFIENFCQVIITERERERERDDYPREQRKCSASIWKL